MTPLRAAFVMEQTLGHVTHYRNLRDVAVARSTLEPTWLPIPFDVSGPAGRIPLFGSNWSVRASLRARRALDGVLAHRPIDAILFHTQVTSLFSVPLMRRVPSIISLDATPVNYDSVGRHYGHRAAGDGWLDRQKRRLNRDAFHAAKLLVAWSEWARRSLVDDYGVPPERTRVIAPGAAPAYVELGRQRLASRGTDRPDSRPVRLLFVGGDFARKGGPLLLECMRGPLGECCELDVVTRDQAPAQHNVRVHRGLGPNSAALLRLFAQADVFVLPSLGECLAVVLMEATAAALPVVTTDVGALREALVPGESGLLVPPGDAAALAGALMALAADRSLRERMGRAGHALACARFDASQNNRALLDLVAEAAQSGADTRRRA